MERNGKYIPGERSLDTFKDPRYDVGAETLSFREGLNDAQEDILPGRESGIKGDASAQIAFELIEGKEDEIENIERSGNKEKLLDRGRQKSKVASAVSYALATRKAADETDDSGAQEAARAAANDADRARKANAARQAAEEETASKAARANKVTPSKDRSNKVSAARRRAARKAARSAAAKKKVSKQTATRLIEAVREKLFSMQLLIPILIVLILVFGIILVTSIVGGLAAENSKTATLDGLPPYITNEHIEAALECQEKYGHPAGATIAQIIAESGQGDHMSKLATRDHNLFGMKYVSSQSAHPEVIGSANWITGEEYNGSNVTITAAFTVFKSDRDCIIFRSRVFLQYSNYANNSLIQQAIQEKSSDKMAEGLKAAGWATSSAYVDSLKNILRTYNLYRLDNMSLASYRSGQLGGTIDGSGTASQANVALLATSGSIPGTGGMCQAWVEAVYRRAGLSFSNTCCATGAWIKYGSSTDRNPPLGATVFGHSNPRVGGGCHGDWGHVGIYVGNGNVASCVGGGGSGVRIESIDSWIAGFGWNGWGWMGSVDLSRS